MLVDLIIKAKDILQQDQPSDQALMEVENSLSAFLEALATERITEPVDKTDLEHANRLLREVRRKRSRRLADAQALATTEVSESAQQKASAAETGTPHISPQLHEDDSYDPLSDFLPASHNAEAEAMMDSAEEAFYAGNYQIAIPLYEKVLALEPSWLRAQEHRDEAEEFLRSGNIPSVALPPDAGKAFGKAQSAARVFRYQTALNYLDEAFASLKEAGISRWREGEDLRQDLENQIQAHEVYQEGIALLGQGDLQGALSKVQAAASAVVLPEYVDKASEIRSDLSTLYQIGDVLNLSSGVLPEKLAETCQKLDRLTIKYGEIPQITRLNNRLETILPVVTSSLVEDIQRKIRQAETASALKIVNESYHDAKQDLAILQVLQPENTMRRLLDTEIQDALAEVNTLEGSLEKAQESLNEESRFFPRSAFLISKAVRKRYPQDPNVLALNRKLRWYPITLGAGSIILGIILLLALWFGGRRIAGAVRAQQLARTPSPTITASITPTSTITQTPTETPTPGPTATETPYYTQTPTAVITGTVLRNLFARQSCYEAYPATGRIPEGAVVTLISIPNRVFDDLNRECMLVEYRTEEANVIGYILLIDLSFP
jgi:tetratricopeptide (TPR) repeat protein